MTWNHEWVSVKEKLPTSDEIFIVTILDESGDIPWSYVTTGWYFREAGCWIVDNEKTSCVVAWMSMPLPWRKTNPAEESRMMKETKIVRYWNEDLQRHGKPHKVIEIW